jgi:transposase
MSAPPLCIGVDVANAPLDMALRPTGDHWAVANDDARMATLVARLLAVPPTLIVLEATGGLSAGRGGGTGRHRPPSGGQSPPRARRC